MGQCNGRAAHFVLWDSLLWEPLRGKLLDLSVQPQKPFGLKRTPAPWHHSMVESEQVGGNRQSRGTNDKIHGQYAASCGRDIIESVYF